MRCLTGIQGVAGSIHCIEKIDFKNQSQLKWKISPAQILLVEDNFTVKIRTSEKFAVITLKFEQPVMLWKDADGIANSVDPDQTAPVGLHCLPRPIYPKT